MCAGRTAALILVVEALIRSGNCGSSPFSRKWCWDRSGLEPSQNKSALFQPKRRCTPVHQVRTRPLRLCVKDPSQQVPAKWEEARLCLCLLASLCEGADEVGQMYGKANVGTKWESEQEKVSIKMHWVFGEKQLKYPVFFSPPPPPRFILPLHTVCLVRFSSFEARWFFFILFYPDACKMPCPNLSIM